MLTPTATLLLSRLAEGILTTETMRAILAGLLVELVIRVGFGWLTRAASRAPGEPDR